MTIEHLTLHGMVNPDLRDDVFTCVQVVHGAEDWRHRVPMVIRNVWMEMSPGDRLSVVLVAMDARDAMGAR